MTNLGIYLNFLDTTYGRRNFQVGTIYANKLGTCYVVSIIDNYIAELLDIKYNINRVEVFAKNGKHIKDALGGKNDNKT